MKTIGFIICFSILSFCAIAQEIKVTTPPVRELKGERPVKRVIPMKTVLNGQHTLHNTNGQITKEGVFENNVLLDGKNYIYNENGTLKHIELYKNGAMVGTETK